MRELLNEKSRPIQHVLYTVLRQMRELLEGVCNAELLCALSSSAPSSSMVSDSEAELMPIMTEAPGFHHRRANMGFTLIDSPVSPYRLSPTDHAKAAFVTSARTSPQWIGQHVSFSRHGVFILLTPWLQPDRYSCQCLDIEGFHHHVAEEHSSR